MFFTFDVFKNTVLVGNVRADELNVLGVVGFRRTNFCRPELEIFDETFK